MAGSGYAGNSLAAGAYASGALAQSAPAATINERLNRVSESLQYQCERLESVLNRVHGNPTPIRQGGENATKMPTLPMLTITDHLEAVLSRMQEIASSAERVA